MHNAVAIIAVLVAALAVAVVVIVLILVGPHQVCQALAGPRKGRARQRAKGRSSIIAVAAAAAREGGSGSRRSIASDASVDEEDAVTDECVRDADCGEGRICRRSGIYYPSAGATALDAANLAEQRLARLHVGLLDDLNLNAEDVREFEWQGTEWHVISTNTPTLILNSAVSSRAVRANVAPSDLYVGSAHIYALARGVIYSLTLHEAMNSDTWTFRAAPGLPTGVRALEGAHDGTFFTLLTREGTFFVEHGNVTRRLKRTLPMVLGKTQDDYAVFDAEGVEIYPNNTRLAGMRAGVITAANRFFTFDPERNGWVKRLRSVGAEPVLVSRGMCVAAGVPDYTRIA